MSREIELHQFPALVGKELGCSSWWTIDQTRINAFARATDDFQWIHVDEARANREAGGTVAHGYLTLSMLAPLVEDAWRPIGISHALNYGIDRMRFTAVVRAGDRISCRETLLSVDPKNGGLLLRRKTVVDIEGNNRPALVGEMIMLVYPNRS